MNHLSPSKRLINCCVTDRFVASCEELRVRDRVTQVGSYDVRAQSLGRLVRHLDAILQHRHWEVW